MTLPIGRYEELMRDPKLKLTPADHEASNGFLHFCDEWDGLLIDKDDPEFSCCSCAFSTEFDPVTGKLRLRWWYRLWRWMMGR